MLTHNDSKIKLHKICQILKNCQCKWLLISGRLQDLLQALLRFLRSFFLHGYDCIGCVSKFPEKFLFYLGMIVSVVLPSFVPPQRNDDFLKITILHWELCDPPLLNHHNSWKELEMFRCSGTLSSANPCLNSCNQSSTPCNSSLCNSSSLSFLVGFFDFCWFTRRFLLCKFARTFTSSWCWNFRASQSLLRWRCRRSKWWWSRRPGRWTKDNEWHIIRCVTIEVLAIFDEMWFLTDGPRVTSPKFLAEFQANEPPVCLEETLPSPTVVGFSISSRFPIRLCESLSCKPCACSLRNLSQTIYIRSLLLMRLAKPTPR